MIAMRESWVSEIPGSKQDSSEFVLWKPTAVKHRVNWPEGETVPW